MLAYKLKFITLFFLAINYSAMAKGTVGSRGALNTRIQKLPEINQEKEEPYRLAGEPSKTRIDRYNCRTETVVGAPGFSEMMFKRTSTDVLYPGALLKGESIENGVYALSPLPRKPMILTVNLQSLQGSISTKVKNPAYSTIQSAIHDILSQEVVGDAGAEVSWEIMTVYSMTQLKAALGMNVSFVDIFGVGSDFKFEAGAKYQRVIARYCQKYFDVVVDQPPQPSDFIDFHKITAPSLEAALGDVSPAYVSAVNYGRMALFYFESTNLSFNLENAVRGAVNLACVDVPATVGAHSSASANAVFSNSTCKAYILGGSGSDAASAAVNGIDDFQRYIANGGTYNRDSPGKPISFTLRYLSNNNPVRLIMASEYEKTTCFPVANTYRFTLERIGTSQVNALSPYGIFIVGPITVRGGGKGNPRATNGKATLFHRPGTPGLYVAPNNPINVGNSVEIEFDPLSDADRERAWIEIDVNGLWYNWGFANYAFAPQVTKLYLNELKSGDKEHITVGSTQNRLMLDYKIDALCEKANP